MIATTSAIINYLMLRANNDPAVVVYAAHDPRRPSIINLVIENVGRGLAYNIHFTANQPIPKSAFGIEKGPSKEPAESMTDGPLIDGIPFLAAGDTRVITWGQYGGLCEALKDKSIEIVAHYQSKPALRFLNRNHSTGSAISMKSFAGTDASDNNWDKRIAEHLKDIDGRLRRVIDVQTGSIRIQGLTEQESD